MERYLTVVVVGLIILSCTPKGNESKSYYSIAGTYFREYSFKIVNQETGVEIGMRTVRDTVFIRPVNDEYEVSNHKWRLNDYDNEGWQNMQHNEDRPKPTFKASLTETKNALRSDDGLTLHLDREKSMVFWEKGALYHEIKE